MDEKGMLNSVSRSAHNKVEQLEKKFRVFSMYIVQPAKIEIDECAHDGPINTTFVLFVAWHVYIQWQMLETLAMVQIQPTHCTSSNLPDIALAKHQSIDGISSSAAKTQPIFGNQLVDLNSKK